LVRKIGKRKLSLLEERKKRLSETEDDWVPETQAIRRLDPIRVEPSLAVIVALDVEHIWVAIGVGHVQNTVYSTTLRILSELYIIPHNNALVFCTKYLSFFRVCISPPFLTLILNALSLWILVSVARDLNLLHIHLRPP